MIRLFTKLFLFLSLVVPLSLKASMVTPNGSKELPSITISDQYLNIPFLESNREVMIIQQDQFKAHNIIQPVDLLKYISDIEVVERGPNGGQADIKMSGGTFEQVLILVNGHKVMDAQTGHHLMNLPFSMDQVSRVEIVKGAAARIYGVNSLMGAINFIVNEYDHPQLTAHVSWGTNFNQNEKNRVYQQLNTHLTKQWKKGNTLHSLSGTYQKGNGYRYNTSGELAKIFYAINAPINDRVFIEGFISGMYNSFGANGFYAPPNDKESKENVNTSISGIKVNMDLFHQWQSSLSTSYRYNYDDYIFVRQNPSYFRNIHNNHLLQLNWNNLHPLKKMDIKWGMSFDQHWLISTNLGERRRNNIGGYLDFSPKWNLPLKVSGGIYVNHNTDWGWQWLPGVDASYAINQHMSAFAAWSTGHRMPTYTDLYYVGPSNIGNESLTPELSQQFDVGWKYAKGNTQWSITVFHRNVYDLIDWVKVNIEDPWKPENFGQVNTLGINLHGSMKLRWRDHWSFDFIPSLTYLSSKTQHFEDLISNYQLEHLKFKSGVLASISYRDLTLAPGYRFEVRNSNHSYSIIDLNANYAYRNTKLYVAIKNIGDLKQVSSSSIPLVGRWVDLGMKWMF